MSGLPAEEILGLEVRRLHGLPADVPLGQIPEPGRTYVEYALGTLDRGRAALAEIRPFGWRAGCRFLDAGCAYGGFLAAAVEAGASEVVGVDVDERYLGIARKLVPALGIAARLENGSLSDAVFVAGLGTFDVITCADVIEHVDDVGRTLDNLARALRPGGLLYLAVPNAWSPAWVLSDPHYQLFGITLLPPAEARLYKRLATGSDYYDVGEFHRLSHYRRSLERRGLEARLINPSQGDPGEAVAAVLDQAAELRRRAEGFADERLPEELQRKLRREVLALAGEIERRAAAGRTAWWQRRRGRLTAGFLADYGVATWHLLAWRR